jgi:hypothetical protein
MQDPQQPIKKISGKYQDLSRPIIEDGVYEAEITDWWVNEMMFGRPKLIITCNVTTLGQVYELACFINVDLDEDRRIKPPGRRSNLYKLTRELFPNDGEEHDLDYLIGIRCLAEVGTCDRDERKNIKPKRDWFSVIRTLRSTSHTTNREVLPF